jgi:membrane protein implicated in regulation of membrane protease activity
MSLLTSLVFRTLARRFARTRGRPSQPVDMEGIRRTVAASREPALIAAHSTAVVALTAAGGVLAVAGITVLLLGPLWLGIATTVLAAICAVTAVPEVLRIRRTVRARRLRRHARALYQELDGSPPT